MKRIVILVMALALGTGTYTISGAQITGSAHDFSGDVWSGGEICLPCHTPHNADTTVSDSPLWNHEVTTATFTVYSSPTLDVVPDQPDGVSKLCLSCHDGTVALDSFGGTAGSLFISGNANLTTDLSDDHPISIRWQHQTDLPGCGMCHFSYPLPFFGTSGNMKVECATCHDAHNTSGLTAMLRETIEGSALCLRCHGK